MSFLQWLLADAIDGMSDAALALSARCIVWTVTETLRSLF